MSAPTRCSAIANDVNVRVLASKNRLTTQTPCSRLREGGRPVETARSLEEMVEFVAREVVEIEETTPPHGRLRS